VYLTQLAGPQVLLSPTTSFSTDAEEKHTSISKESIPEEDVTTRRAGLRFNSFSSLLSFFPFLRSKPKDAKDTGYERLLNEHCK
jgi:hypothetical protein